MTENTSDNVDAAFERFSTLLPALRERIPTLTTEQDVRAKLIDPIFSEVLGWNHTEIHHEDFTSDGFIDYAMRASNSTRIIVEAKTNSASFGLNNRSAGRPYKLNGPVLSKRPMPYDAIMQAARYAGVKNSELACVTNGTEWIIFRGSRLGDGKDTLSGMAFVFPSLDAINECFSFFYDLLGRHRVEGYVFRGHFQEAEGQPIRAKSPGRTLRPIDGYRLIEQDTLSADVDRIMSAFFKQISGDDDPDMLAQCFITTKESQIADDQLSRITDDLSSRIRNLDTSVPQQIQQLIEKVRDTNRNEFVLIVGGKGSGKSTFVDRFFRYVLPSDLRSQCAVARINVGKSPGHTSSINDWLDRTLVEALEATIFPDSTPTFEDLQGMFFDEYRRRMKGPYRHLYDSDKEQFKINFGEHIDNVRSSNPQVYIHGLLRHLVTSRRITPCLVFDNADHFSIEFQERVFQYARSLYETEVCLVLLPITEKTSWQLSRQGALQSFDSEVFFLPSPLPKKIIQRRVWFLEQRLSDETPEHGRGYFIGKGIQLSFDDIKGFVASLHHIFVETGQVSQWIGNLSNNDVRKCLTLTRNVVASPYLRVEQLVKAYIAGDTINVGDIDIKRAIIRKGYNYYPTGNNAFVQNSFALHSEIESSPLLAARLLRLLRDAKHHDASGFEDYVTIDQIIDYIQAIGIERRSILLCLDSMLKTGLCWDYDPTITSIEGARQLQITPAGLQHLRWTMSDEVYIGSMAYVTPINDLALFDQLKGAAKEDDPRVRWINVTVLFIDYLLSEDALSTRTIDHISYSGQDKLLRALESQRNRIKNRL